MSNADFDPVSNILAVTKSPVALRTCSTITSDGKPQGIINPNIFDIKSRFVLGKNVTFSLISRPNKLKSFGQLFEKKIWL